MIVESSSVTVNDLMQLARMKIFGRKESFRDCATGALFEPSATEALAILGVRACIDVVPQGQVSQDLVAQHMRTLYHVSETRQSIISAYFSEPVLVQAAAQLTNETSIFSFGNSWEFLLRMLIQSLRNGMVDAGFRGELVARILLLLAWDKCCIANLVDKESVLSSGVFLRAVPLMGFLETLLNLDDSTIKMLKAKLDGAKGTAWVRCSHFIKIDYVPNSEHLLMLYQRGAVAITKELQAGVDIVIPIVFAEGRDVPITKSMMSCAFLQAKNRQRLDAQYPYSATTGLTDAACGIEVSKDLPFMSLYMSLGPCIPKGMGVIATPNLLHRTSPRIKYAEDSRQICLSVFTLGVDAYKVLDHTTADLLHQIGRNWIDPIVLHQDSKQFCGMVRTMMPCQRLQEPKPERHGGESGVDQDATEAVIAVTSCRRTTKRSIPVSTAVEAPEEPKSGTSKKGACGKKGQRLKSTMASRRGKRKRTGPDSAQLT